MILDNGKASSRVMVALLGQKFGAESPPDSYHTFLNGMYSLQNYDHFDKPESVVAALIKAAQRNPSEEGNAFLEKISNPSRWVLPVRSGRIFFEEWERHWVLGTLPRFDRLTLSLDSSGRSKRRRYDDYTVIQLWGMFASDHYLLSQKRARMSVTDAVEALFDMADAANATYGREVSATLVQGSDLGEMVVRRLRQRLAGVRNIRTPGKLQGKTVLANEVVELWRDGRVLLPPVGDEGFVWLQDYLCEQRAFPCVAHDDQVEAMMQYLRWAMGLASRERMPERPYRPEPIYRTATSA